jgi:hypothetical protein
MFHLKCQDARDKIYGVREFIRWPDGTAPVPNYEKTSFELAKEVMGIILLQSPSLKGLRGLGPLTFEASRVRARSVVDASRAESRETYTTG